MPSAPSLRTDVLLHSRTDAPARHLLVCTPAGFERHPEIIEFLREVRRVTSPLFDPLLQPLRSIPQRHGCTDDPRRAAHGREKYQQFHQSHG
jgi:hypothetical protein